MRKNQDRVVVLMSGGVDSSVAAAICRKQGYDLVGVSLRFWLCGDEERASSCCGIDGVASARSVAEALEMPHYVIDCREEFERSVLEPSWQEYNRGRTPNPCIHCNSTIKFGPLLQGTLKKLGARWLVTGHHAVIEHETEHPSPALLRGRDPRKDQSYFLFALSPHQLAKSLMPIGGMTKAEVREQARTLDLPCADRSESQDACLSGGDDCFAEMLRRRFDEQSQPGIIVDHHHGTVLGNHDGIHRFTIGQRRGLGVSANQRAYVVSIDAPSGMVRVSTDPNDLLASKMRIHEARWIVPSTRNNSETVEVQIRYQHHPAKARLFCQPDRSVVVRFEEPQRAITPGQAAVFYQGQRVLGGGWIAEVMA